MMCPGHRLRAWGQAQGRGCAGGVWSPCQNSCQGKASSLVSMVTCPPGSCSCSPSQAPVAGAVGAPSQPCAHISPRWVLGPQQAGGSSGQRQLAHSELELCLTRFPWGRLWAHIACGQTPKSKLPCNSGSSSWSQSPLEDRLEFQVPSPPASPTPAKGEFKNLGPCSCFIRRAFPLCQGPETPR